MRMACYADTLLHKSSMTLVKSTASEELSRMMASLFRPHQLHGSFGAMLTVQTGALWACRILVILLGSPKGCLWSLVPYIGWVRRESCRNSWSWWILPYSAFPCRCCQQPPS